MSPLARYKEWRDNGVPSGVRAEEWIEILTDLFGFSFDHKGPHGDIYKHDWLIENRENNRQVPFLTVSKHYKKQGGIYTRGIKSTINKVLKPMDDELGITAKLTDVESDEIKNRGETGGNG